MVEAFSSITTIAEGGWRRQIDEIERLGIEAICLFPTCLERDERRELYAALRRTPVTRIPLVHLRHDMEAFELEYFLKQYRTKVFNIHPSAVCSFVNDLSDYHGMTCIENSGEPFKEEEIKKYKGICLDFSHLEDDRLFRVDWYRQIKKILAHYPCPVGHISAVGKSSYVDPRFGESRELHCFEHLSEFDYMRNYRRYLPPILALELENPLKDQLAVKKYLEKLLGL